MGINERIYIVMKKNLMLVLIGISACLALTACGKKEKEVETEEVVTAEIIAIEETPAVVETETEEVAEECPEGMYYSELTGLPISLEIEKQKPIAAKVD